MDSRKEFHAKAPEGWRFDSFDIHLTPEQQSWIAKMRGKFGKIFSREKSVE